MLLSTQPLYWYPSGNPQGSNSYWDSTNKNWNTSASGGSLTQTYWPTNNGNYYAVFGGTGGTVTINGSGVTVPTIQFNTNGYIIAGNSSDTLGVPSSGTMTVIVSSGVSATISAPITGTGGLTVSGGSSSGGGTLVLSGANSYGSSTTLTTLNSGCTLDLNNPSALGSSSSTLAIGGGTIDSTISGGATLSNAQQWNGNFIYAGTYPLTFNGNVTTASTLQVTVSGGSPLTLGGSLTASGSLTVAGSGTLTDNNAITINNGGLTYSGSGTLTANGAITVNNGALTDTGSGMMALNGQVTINNNGSGTLTLSGASGGTLILDNTNSSNLNSFATVNISNGTLKANAANVLPNGVAVSLASSGGAQLVLNASQTIGSISGGGSSGGGVVLYNSAGLTVSPTASDTFAGVISNSGGGSGGLTVNGSSTLVLTAANTFTGPTTINAGATLQLGNGSSGGSLSSNSVISIANSGILALCPAGTLNFPNSFSSGGSGQVSIGLPGGSGGGTVTLAGINDYCTTTIYNGTLVVGGTSGVGSGTITIDGGALQVTGSFSLSQGITLGNYGGTIVVNTGCTLTTTASGMGGLTLSGGGYGGSPAVLILTGSNDYSGTTNIAYGTTLQLGNGSSSFAFNNNSSSIYDYGALVLSPGSTPLNLSNNAIAGTGSVNNQPGRPNLLNKVLAMRGGSCGHNNVRTSTS